jgi:hypothetical protein
MDEADQLTEMRLICHKILSDNDIDTNYKCLICLLELAKPNLSNSEAVFLVVSDPSMNEL